MNIQTSISVRSAACAVLSCFVAAIGSPLVAQVSSNEDADAIDLTELDLEALMAIEVHQVYGASKRDQSTLDAPASVSIVTGDEIRARGYRTLDEVLRSLCGVYATYDRSYRHVGVRGFLVPGDFNSRLLVTVDGHRLNDNVYGSANLGREAAIDFATIERVEFIRGPGSALYGSNAVFGVINVVTRRAVPEASLDATVGVGSYESYEASLTHGRESIGGWSYLVSARGFDSAGQRLVYDEFAATPTGGVTRDGDQEFAYGLFAHASREDFDAQFGYAWREKGIPTGQYGVNFDDPDNRFVDAQGYLDLSWRTLVAENCRLLTRAYYDDYAYYGWYAFDDTAGSGIPDLENRDDVHGRRLGGEVQAELDLGENQRVTAGLDVRWNVAQDQRNYDMFGTYVDSEESSLEWGAFVQDEIRLGERTTLVLGVRADHYEGFGVATSPRAAAVYRLDELTALKLLIGTAYRAPNAYELYYGDNVSFKANPDLDPEQITTYELVFERYFGTSWRTAVSLYQNDVRDLIAQMVDPNDGLLVFENADDMRARGIELQAEWSVANAFRVALSQAFQDVEDDATGRRPINSPNRITQAHLEAPLWGRHVFGVIETIGIGSRDTLAGDSLDGHWLTNVQLRAPNVWDGVDLELGLYNLFDESYSDPAGDDFVQDSIEQDGLSFLFRLRMRR